MAETMQLQEIKCSNCAGEVQFDPGTQLTVCNFCGSTFDIKTAKKVDVIEPDGLVPFKVDRELFNNAVLQWLSEGDLTPDDVLTSVVFNDIAGLYLPFYLFTGQYDVDWTASSGYYRQETYTAYETVTSNGISREVPVARSRTITDWRPCSGKISGKFKELGIASKLLPDAFASFCEEASWETDAAKGFDKRYTMGFALEPFSVESDHAFDGRVKRRVSAIVDKHVASLVPGDTQRDMNWTGDIRKEKTNIYMPFWYATYQYANNKYSCLLDGQKDSRIAGIRPIDEKRAKKIKFFFLPFKISIALSVVALVISFFSEDFEVMLEVFSVGSFISLLFGAIGWVRESKLIAKSKQIRKEILLKVKSNQSGLKEEIISSD